MPKPVSPPDPHTVLPLVAHLRANGEANPEELATLRAQVWVPVVCEAGFAQTVLDGMLLATLTLLDLPADASETVLLRAIGFRYPPYRRRLLAVLAQGLVDAAQKNLYDRLEAWATLELLHLTADLNALLDELEASEGRMVDWKPEQVQARFSALHADLGDWSEWDRALLNHTAAPFELFSVVMDKFARAALPSLETRQAERPLALLPELPLRDGVSDQIASLLYCPWTTARRHIHSSLPLFDIDGQPLFDTSQSTETVWQDALAQQPFYRAVIHLAYLHRLSLGESAPLRLHCMDDLASTQIEFGGQTVGLLRDRLSGLVRAMGYHPSLPLSLVAARLTNVLENLMAVHILNWQEDLLILAEDYALSLSVPPRAQTLGRGQGQQEREAILRFLQL